MADFIGKQVELLPYNGVREAKTWTKAHGSIVKLLAWDPCSGKFSVRAADGRRKTFGPYEATWMPLSCAVESRKPKERT